MNRDKQIFLFFLLVFTLTIASCKSTVIPSPLANTSWVLKTLNGNPLIQDTDITLEFWEDHLAGAMGCNHYGGGPDSGGYSAQVNGAFAIRTPFAVTVQLCTEPAGIMQQEKDYIDALLSAEVYGLSDDQMVLYDAAGKAILVYHRN
jgi:heat shock protein HslJ